MINLNTIPISLQTQSNDNEKIHEPHHKWISSSRFVSAELLYFNIFVIADIAFSVGFIFSGSRLLGVLIISTKTGTH